MPDLETLEGVKESFRSAAGRQAVFDKFAQTLSSNEGIEADDVTRQFKSLQGKAMIAPNALPTVKPGRGQHRVQGGDYNHVIYGDQHVNVSGNDTLRVGKSQTHDIEGDAVMLYSKDRKQATQGDEEWVVMGKRESWVMGESTDNFVAKHDVNAPESFEWKHSESSFVASRVETCYYGQSYYGMQTEIGIVDNELSITGLSYDKLHVEAQEIVPGIKEALEEAAATEALENPAAMQKVFSFVTEAATVTAGVTVGGVLAGAKDAVVHGAEATWNFTMAHPLVAAAVVATAVVAVVSLQPEVLAAVPEEVALGGAATAATAVTTTTVAAPEVGAMFGGMTLAMP